MPVTIELRVGTPLKEFASHGAFRDALCRELSDLAARVAVAVPIDPARVGQKFASLSNVALTQACGNLAACLKHLLPIRAEF